MLKKSGRYFCHLCSIEGEEVQSPSGNNKIRYPLRRVVGNNQLVLNGQRDDNFWKTIVEQKVEEKYGINGHSPILDQDWNPTPTTMCAYDSKHCLYEGLIPEMMSL